MSSALTWLVDLTTIGILLSYELYFVWFERHRPARFARSAHAGMREDWFRALSAQSGSELLLVQTLRNSLMSATMTASTAALGLIGTVTISAAALHETFERVGSVRDAITPRLALEFVLLSLLFASLMSSAMAVRFYNHVGFIGGLPVGSAERKRWSAVGIKYVRRAGILYSWGLRHLVVVAPVLASILHPAAGPVAALVVVGVLLHFDRMHALEEPTVKGAEILPSLE
jgi:hypothetical protein